MTVLLNQPPTANAGPDQEITLPGVAQLNGTATDDGLPRGSVLETFWSFVSGPGPVVFPDATLLNATAIFTVPGTYVLRLTASDGKLSASDETDDRRQAEAVHRTHLHARRGFRSGHLVQRHSRRREPVATGSHGA